MTQEEWLGDYFGTPFDELQSTIRAYAPPAPPQTAPPQATPSELPSPPGSPESYSYLHPAIRREIEHPFFVVGEKIRKVREDPFSSDSFGTYLDALGAARVLEGGGIARSVPIPRRFYNPGKFITGEEQLGPAPAGAKPYVPAPPPGGYKFLQAFRNAVRGDDEVGAINVIRNATKEGVEIPFKPDEIFKAQSPYVMREIDRHMLQTKGYSPLEGFFRPPPGYLEP